MAFAYYVGNAALQSQIVTITVSAVAVGGTLTATINGKAVTYTCITGDTTSTAASGWLALLQGSFNPEFQEITWSVAANVITATAGTAGVPFAGMTGGLVASAAGGAAIVQATTQANSSPSDVGDLNNWMRNGVAALPISGDDIVLKDCTVPMTVNCDALTLIRPLSFTRWQSHTGQIGLPFTNPLGYKEYKATYLEFAGTNGGTLTVTIGLGQGDGPPLEKYEVIDTGQMTLTNILAGRNIEYLPASGFNPLNISNANVSIGMNPGESITLSATIQVDSGGSLSLGENVSFSVTNTIFRIMGSTFNLFANSAPLSINLVNSTALVGSAGLTYGIVSIVSSAVVWVSNSNITTLTMKLGATLDLSQDFRPMTITNCTMEADTCQINDLQNRLTMTNPFAMTNESNAGPFIYGPSRGCRLT